MQQLAKYQMFFEEVSANTEKQNYDLGISKKCIIERTSEKKDTISYFQILK